MNSVGLRRWLRSMMNRVGDGALASVRWSVSFGGSGEDDG